MQEISQPDFPQKHQPQEQGIKQYWGFATLLLLGCGGREEVLLQRALSPQPSALSRSLFLILFWERMSNPVGTSMGTIDGATAGQVPTESARKITLVRVKRKRQGGALDELGEHSRGHTVRPHSISKLPELPMADTYTSLPCFALLQ
jgi:hypothetical protein